MARVEPNRKWFGEAFYLTTVKFGVCSLFYVTNFYVLFLFVCLGNTRVVTQNALQAFNEAMNKIKADPYKVVMNPTKNPVTLLSYTPKAVLILKYSTLFYTATQDYYASFL